MANSTPPSVCLHQGRAVRSVAVMAKVFLAVVVTGLSYVSLASGAAGPTSGPLGEHGLPQRPKIAEASLSFSGGKPVITGSVASLFETPMFAGPNRAEKTDRVRPKVDALQFANNFEEARIRLAALRAPSADAEALGQTGIADVKLPTSDDKELDGPRISVASIDPSIGTGALEAIDGIAPSSSVPTPAMPSEQLAYARETAPVTGSFSRGKTMQVSDKERWCLATAIYFEARGENYRGQVGVAQVVLNRVKDHRYPSTICGVVFQNQSKRNACQFSFACDGIPEVVTEKEPWAQAEEIAARALDGELYLTEVGDATHYHATYVRPAWAPRMQKVTQIGMHVFYKFKRGWLFG
ncbi:cell wall hydrolase [Devosia sp. PTR5]|uniref:Cell wall hydrolase n=2 Tax=Devosia oryzisoli TaxID=2774138 RepID=A0A927FWT1_9HYPH|nr:cell wall hydrolase [Devosia oryzisoli]